MPARDYELAQKARQDGWVKISVKWLNTPLTCDPVACGGRCCIKHKGTPTTAHYHPNELSLLPEEILQFVESDGAIKLNWKGDCMLIPYCMENSSIIPTECRLFPLGFSKWGRLIIKKPAWTGRCPGYRQGDTPAYLSLKQCLTDVFGGEVYNRIVETMENGRGKLFAKASENEE